MGVNEALGKLQPLLKTMLASALSMDSKVWLTLDGTSYVNWDQGFVVLVCGSCLFAIRCPELMGTDPKTWTIAEGTDLQELVASTPAGDNQGPSWSRVVPSTISYSNHPMKVTATKGFLKQVKALTKDSREALRAVNAERKEKGWAIFPPTVTFQPAKEGPAVMFSGGGMNFPIQAEDGVNNVILDGDLLTAFLSAKMGDPVITLSKPTRIDFPGAVAVIANLAPRRELLH